MRNTEQRPATATLDWGKLIETALDMPGDVGNTYSRLYSYSWLNQAFLYMQGVEPQPVATFKRWQALGRHVVRGAKAREIIRPVTIKREQPDGSEVVFTRFKSVRCIFPYQDTEGDELPPYEIPHWDLGTALKNLDITQLPYHDFEGNVQGVSWDRNIAINPVARFPLKTTLHEAAHVVSGHTVPEKLAEYALHRGTFEFEAEGSAHLIGHELGVLSDEQATVSRGYLQNWLQGERPPEASIRRVFATTDAVLKAGRMSVEATI